MRFVVSVVLAILPTVALAADKYVIQNVNVIPMTSEKVLSNHSVLIADGVVQRICSKAKACRASGSIVIDGKGKYLIPGLSDMHAHTDGLAPLAVKGIEISEQQRLAAMRTQSQQLRQYVLFGVTTLRDTGGGPLNLEARQRIYRGEQMGPTITSSLAAMDGTPPLRAATIPFSEPSQAADFVRRTAREGYDLVKIYSTLNKTTFDAIMDTADEVGLPVIGHVPMPIELEYAIQRGMRSIEHLSGYDMACAGMDAGLQPTMADVYQGWAWCSPEKIKQLSEMTAKYPTWVVPTMIVVEGLMTDYKRYAEGYSGEELKYTPPVLATFFDFLYQIFDPRTRGGLAATREVRLALTKALSDAGVPLLTGTDTMASGYNVHQEMALFVEAGLTPYQALEASTAEPARYFDRAGEFGTIVEGANADLVLLAANPLEDIANARRIEGVMLRGDWLSPARLEREHAALQAEYAADREMLNRGAMR